MYRFEYSIKSRYSNIYINPLQGGCGSCWAFSTTSTAADHFCIKGHANTQLSAEHQIQCDTSSDGCNGGFVGAAFEFQKTNGTVPLRCKSYRGTSTRRCYQTCDDETDFTDSVMKIKSHDKLTTVEAAKQALVENGPFTAVYMVRESFTSFFQESKNAKFVYSHHQTNDSDPDETWHAVKVVGYGNGTDSAGDTVPYWLVQNSWGTRWADGGYFRIRMANATYEDPFSLDEDMEQPSVEAYNDPCSQHLDCAECLREGKAKDADGKEHLCSYCLSSDRCISVKEKEATSNSPQHIQQPTKASRTRSSYRFAPRRSLLASSQKGRFSRSNMTNEDTPAKTYVAERGSCETITQTCPIDDCIQFSHDPLRCSLHSGCGWCATTKKCKKGSNGVVNSGFCLDFKQSTEAVKTSSPCLEIPQSTNPADCEGKNGTNGKCVYCHSTGLCLESDSTDLAVTMGRPVTGQCKDEYFKNKTFAGTIPCIEYKNQFICPTNKCFWNGDSCNDLTAEITSVDIKTSDHKKRMVVTVQGKSLDQLPSLCTVTLQATGLDPSPTLTVALSGNATSKSGSVKWPDEVYGTNTVVSFSDFKMGSIPKETTGTVTPGTIAAAAVDKIEGIKDSDFTANLIITGTNLAEFTNVEITLKKVDESEVIISEPVATDSTTTLTLNKVPAGRTGKIYFDTDYTIKSLKIDGESVTPSNPAFTISTSSVSNSDTIRQPNLSLKSTKHLRSSKSKIFNNTEVGDADWEKEKQCLALDCSSCTKSKGCIWCHSTQSCMAYNAQADKPSVSYCSNPDTYPNWPRCDSCSSYSNCGDCALDSKCVWFEEILMCVPGIINPSVPLENITKNKEHENAIPIAYKKDCAIVLTDESSWADRTSGATSVIPKLRNLFICLLTLVSMTQLW
ncbi:putative Cathepsin B [Blattamonas nauphoetae]|uniref:Cathepsin B n=1 Tax=Blattamonas nauphoetae TaxID=2049346 RepID=A0ABQ9YAU3_9EUKA|nr:putative Cathepsin B [Blattamonas nauphoetae]